MSSARLPRALVGPPRLWWVIEELVPDGLWKRVAPLLPLLPLPKPRRYRYPGRRPIDDRATLAGIVFVLKTGINCNQRPPALVGCSRGDLLAAAAPLDRGRRLARPARAAAGPAMRPQRAGPKPVRGRQLPHPSPQRGHHIGPSTVDRGWRGSKHHLICDAGGIPLAVSLTGGNRKDIPPLIPLVDAIPPIRGRRGRPRRRPRPLFADRGYDHDLYRRPPRQRGITSPLARRGVAHGSGLGQQRWVVERSFAWLHAVKRMRTRYERCAGILLGMMRRACALICCRPLRSF